MDERSQEIRGEEARRILDSDIYKEAHYIIEQKLVNELAQQDIAPDKVAHLRALLVAGRKYRQYMEQVLLTGTFAAQELERKRTLRDQVAGTFRR